MTTKAAMPNRSRALVIEPDPAVRRRVCALVQEVGFEACSANREFLREVGSRGFDLVLCDWDEWVALSEVPVAQRHLPQFPRVILLSRLPDESLWVQAIEGGAFDLIEKPDSGPTTEEFRRVVASALNFATAARAA